MHSHDFPSSSIGKIDTMLSIDGKDESSIRCGPTLRLTLPSTRSLIGAIE